MTLESISSILEDLEEALDYEATNDVEKARKVITLGNKLLVRRPVTSGHGGSSVSYDVNQIRALIQTARLWLQANDTSQNSGGVRFLSQGRGYRG